MSETSTDLLGLTGITAHARERVPVRRRESQVTTSAWRLEVTCDQGTGAIVLVEVSAAETCYRGDGIFLGWPQDRMAQLHAALAGPGGKTDTDIELLQLG